jgi:hypothetical protein
MRPWRLVLALSLGLSLAACSSQKQCAGGCACQGQSDCPAGQSCIAGFCAAAQSCTTDLDCTDVADICVGGSCVPGSVDGGPVVPDGGRLDGGLDGGHVDAGSDAGPDGGHGDGGLADGGSGGDGGLDAGPDGGAGGDAGNDAGTPPDSGVADAGCAGNTDCAGGLVCLAGSCQACTASSECITPLICCLSGSCTPGTCVAPGCTSDTECNPPDEICVGGSCVTGCLLGSCDAGLRCENVVTGRCQPASGSGAPGAACQSFSDCATTSSNGNSGDCLSLLLPDGGADSFCSLVCVDTSTQCPPDFACASFGGGGQCIPESLAGGTGDFGAGGIGASCTAGSFTCDSFTGCGSYATGGGDVCSDTCLGPSSDVCPSGWQCDDVTYFSGLLDGGPASCTTNAQCTAVSPDALCFTHALGGPDQCYLVFQQDACFESPTGGPQATTGTACTADTGCKFGLCNNDKCADPCCSSADCPSGYACAPIIEQQFSVLMACLPATGTGTVGTACDPTAATNACRATLSSPAAGVAGEGLCLPADAYSSTNTTGYCSDYCCDDTECGAGFTCTLVEVGTDNLGNGLYSNACVEL